MSDKPYVSRAVSEIDAFFDLWRNNRKLAIAILIIVIISLIGFITNYFYSANKINDLKIENRELKRDLRQAEFEIKSLRDVVTPLINQAITEFPGEEINEALKKIVIRLESDDPFKKPIISVSSTVEIVIASEQKVSTYFIDRGGYLALARDAEKILLTSANNSHARQTGDGRVIYSGVFNMPATDSSVGMPISSIKLAEYIQISFSKIPSGSFVIGGKAIIILNSSHRFEFAVPPQLMQGDKIFIREVSKPIMATIVGYER
jgi:hypothetical protein